MLFVSKSVPVLGLVTMILYVLQTLGKALDRRMPGSYNPSPSGQAVYQVHLSGDLWGVIASFVRHSGCREFRELIAGWSSLVARRAHNPKVVGSNPAPATNI